MEKAKRFSRQGIVRNADQFLLNADGPWHQEVHDFGLNYRLPDILCALGISQIKRLKESKLKKKEIFQTYYESSISIDQIWLRIQLELY